MILFLKNGYEISCEQKINKLELIDIKLNRFMSNKVARSDREETTFNFIAFTVNRFQTIKWRTHKIFRFNIKQFKMPGICERVKGYYSIKMLKKDAIDIFHYYYFSLLCR